ncbi:MAG: AsmA-like C-terminal region-containing protein [Paracoccaceae bacterium]|nr:AsmA-like C-terminal region-containing protein [Paracoccaceae bacterium]
MKITPRRVLPGLSGLNAALQDRQADRSGMISGEPDKPTDTVARPEGDAPAGAAGKPARPTRKERGRQGLRGSMLRSVLGTITVLGLLFGLVAGLLLWSVGRPIAAPDWMRDRIEARIAEALPGMEIAFSDLVLIVDEGWAPRIRLRDVALREVGGPPMMTLGDLEAGVSGEALLRGRLEPGRVILSGARLTLRRMADGTFDLAFGDALPPVEQAPNPAALLEGLDRLLNQPRFAGLTVIDADNLGLRYEDARTGRAWQVDGGRVELRRNGDDLTLRGDVSLLSGYDYATSLSLNYTGQIGTSAAQIGLNFEDMTATDLASQSGALAWLGVLRAPISGAMRVSVAADGSLGPLSVALQIGKGVVQPDDQAAPIPFDSARTYLTYTPQSGQLQFDDLSVRSKWITARAEGRATIAELEDGWPSTLLGQFRILDITASPADLYDTPVQLEEALVDLRLKLDPFELTLGQMTLFDRGQRLLLDGRVGVGSTGWTVAVNGSMDAVLPERILQLWPERLVPKTRNWVADNVHSARLHDVQLGYRRVPGTPDQVYLGFGFDQANVTYARDMPLLTQAAGQATLTGRRFVVSATEGTVTPPQGGQLDVAGTSFIIPDVSRRPTPAQVRLAASGSITGVLAMLDSPNLRFLEKAGRPVDLAKGFAEVTALIDMPLQRPMPLDALRFAASARLRDVESDAIMPGRILRAAAMEVKADTNSLSIGGEGRLGDVPFDAVWSTALRDNTRGQSEVNGTVTLSQAFADEFDLNLPPGTFSGAGQGQIRLDLERDRAPAFRLTSDMAGLGLSVPALGWSLPRATAGTLEVAGTLGNPVAISRIAIDAPGLTLTGALDLTADGQLATARLDRVQAAGWLDGPVTLTGRGAGRGPAIAVTGGQVDLRRSTLSTSAGSGQTSGPLSLALDRLVISDGIALTGFRGEFGTTNGLDGTFSAQVNGQAPVVGRVVPMNGRSAVRIQSDNAGQVFAAAGLLRQAREGAMDLTLRPTGGPGTYDGMLTVRNVRLRDAPALAALINAVSVVGLLEQMNGAGLHFADVEADFLLTPEQVVLRSSSATGASLGVSMDGYYNLARKEMDFQGVFSPVFMLNGIGSLLTRKGEGLIGFTYQLGGTPDAPRVQLNPLSALAPGMLREIFRRPAPEPRAGADG